jgi:hypothetical protein
MRVNKAAVKELERLGLLPKEEKPKKARESFWPYKSRWELQYAAEELSPAVACGLIWDWHYERTSFVLCEASEHQLAVRYIPDFLVILPCGRIEIHEVKGHWRPGAKHKVKALAAMLKPIPIYVVRKVEGQWTKERF